MIIGITGSIATGKSTVSNYLRKKGYLVIDADIIAHHVLETNVTCIKQILHHFPCDNGSGMIDRQKLGDIIFHHENQRKLLDSIVHPYVIDQIQKEVAKNNDEYIFLDIPLLYEAHLEYLCQYIVVVYVSEDIQLQRLQLRNHLSYDQAMHRIRSQISIEKKKQLANYVLYNNKDIHFLETQIECFLLKLKEGDLKWKNC